MAVPPLLSPMLVQYLVGLCCLRWSPEAIDVQLGTLVYDDSAGKHRDVDVTVTVDGGPEGKFAFIAIEVKREARPLDVAAVEQLSMKLADMNEVTHRAVVSASGFTDAAKAKARAHHVALYELCEWDRPLEEQFPGLQMKGLIRDCFPLNKSLLCWPQYKLILNLDSQAPFSIQSEDPLFRRKGRAHNEFKTFGSFVRALLVRSTDILYLIEPAQTVFLTFPIPFGSDRESPAAGPMWPHTHTLDVRSDQIFLAVPSGHVQLVSVTINGMLQWQRDQTPPIYWVMQSVETSEAFAGALVSAELQEGKMTALVFSPATRDIGVHIVRWTASQCKLIRDLSLRCD